MERRSFLPALLGFLLPLPLMGLLYLALSGYEVPLTVRIAEPRAALPRRGTLL
jgi:hypothetical protein